MPAYDAASSSILVALLHNGKTCPAAADVADRLNVEISQERPAAYSNLCCRVRAPLEERKGVVTERQGLLRRALGRAT